MNRHSSGSHAVFILTLTNITYPARQRFAQLHLVELAGSERTTRQASRERGWKRQSSSIQACWLWARSYLPLLINTSCTISGLKLTQLCGTALGVMPARLLHCSITTRVNAKESLSSFSFHARASFIQNGALVNVALDAAELDDCLSKLGKTSTSSEVTAEDYSLRLLLSKRQICCHQSRGMLVVL